MIIKKLRFKFCGVWAQIAAIKKFRYYSWCQLLGLHSIIKISSCAFTAREKTLIFSDKVKYFIEIFQKLGLLNSVGITNLWLHTWLTFTVHFRLVLNGKNVFIKNSMMKSMWEIRVKDIYCINILSYKFYNIYIFELSKSTPGKWWYYDHGVESISNYRTVGMVAGASFLLILVELWASQQPWSLSQATQR